MNNEITITGNITGGDNEANVSTLTTTCSTPALSNISLSSIQSPLPSNSSLVISTRPDSLLTTMSNPSPRSVTPTPSSKSKSSSVSLDVNDISSTANKQHHDTLIIQSNLTESNSHASSSSQFHLDSESSDDDGEISHDHNVSNERNDHFDDASLDDSEYIRIPSEISHSPVDSCHSNESNDNNQATMWLGTEDGW